MILSLKTLDLKVSKGVPDLVLLHLACFGACFTPVRAICWSCIHRQYRIYYRNCVTHKTIPLVVKLVIVTTQQC